MSGILLFSVDVQQGLSEKHDVNLNLPTVIGYVSPYYNSECPSRWGLVDALYNKYGSELRRLSSDQKAIQ